MKCRLFWLGIVWLLAASSGNAHEARDRTLGQDIHRLQEQVVQAPTNAKNVGARLETFWR